MKSLNDQYSASHGSSHETFSDLVFCALIVLVLFIMALAIEVSTRVKANLGDAIEPIAKVTELELSTMTKAEVAELSNRLQQQQQEVNQLREQLKQSATQIESQKARVSQQLAAIGGEQRFTGAREPASLNMAYDYSEDKFHFVSSREVNHAESNLSGESTRERILRRRKELVAVALKARKQRGYSQAEAIAIYQAFSKYKEVEATFDSYQIVDSTVGISFSSLLSAYVAGDTEVSNTVDDLVTLKLLNVYENKGIASEGMYPEVVLQIDGARKRIIINGVTLSPRDAKEILLSLEGRGAVIDLEGITGKAPKWLSEEVLIPAGYISKTPKIPGK